MKRQIWLFFLMGVLVGFFLALYYAREVHPIKFREISPASLNPDARADYITLVASAYNSTGEFGRAQARLALLRDPDLLESVAALPQKRIQQGRPPSEIRALLSLSTDLGANRKSTFVVPDPTETSIALPPTSTATSPPSTPSATLTPTSTPALAFELVTVQKLCDPTLDPPQIQITLKDASGEPLAGVEILVTWDHGQDHFFTGFKPEMGSGYGDFTMTVGQTYALHLPKTETETIVTASEECLMDDNTPYPTSWTLIFQQSR